MNYWMIAWGRKGDPKIRYGDGSTQQEAANDAFGVYAGEMSFEKLPKSHKWLSMQALNIIKERLLDKHGKRQAEWAKEEEKPKPVCSESEWVHTAGILYDKLYGKFLYDKLYRSGQKKVSIELIVNYLEAAYKQGLANASKGGD